MRSKFSEYKKIQDQSLELVTEKLNLSTTDFYNLLKIWVKQKVIPEDNPHYTQLEREYNRKKELQRQSEMNYLQFQKLKQLGYENQEISRMLNKDLTQIEHYTERWYRFLRNDGLSIKEVNALTRLPESELSNCEATYQSYLEAREQKQAMTLNCLKVYAMDFYRNIGYNFENGEKYLIFDLEGIQRPDEIVEIAVINFKGEVKLNTLVRPTHPIGYHVKSITGLSDEMVKKGVSLYKAMRELKKISNGKIMLSWGTDYDSVLLQAAQKRTHIFLKCRFLNAQKIYMGLTGSSHPIALYKACHETDQDHRALSDCEMVLKVLKDSRKLLYET